MQYIICMSSLNTRKIILGIGGGIATYKAVTVASRLRQAGADVTVAMTPAAQQFVGPLSFAAVTGREAQTGMMPPPGADSVETIYPHLYPATAADLFVVLPATADLIAKLAHGIGDDIVALSALSLPPSCRRYFCPAMNCEMWQHPIVADNVARLEDQGWLRLGPESGALGCGMTGIGRMTEPEAIVQRLIEDAIPFSLGGRRIAITAGPTQERIDAVRFISNPSSGKMGRALALASVSAGAQVDYVTGPVADATLPRHPLITIHPVTSADEMLVAMQSCFTATDAAIFAAAVGDYKAAEPETQKLPKTPEGTTLQLATTPDVAATVSAEKRDGQVCVGFALESHDGVDKARRKLARKNLDAIVLNDLTSVAGEDGTYTLLTRAEEEAPTDWGHIEKSACAHRLITWISDKLDD